MSCYAAMKRRPQKNVRREEKEKDSGSYLKGETFFAVSEDAHGFKDEAGESTTEMLVGWRSVNVCDL